MKISSICLALAVCVGVGGQINGQSSKSVNGAGTVPSKSRLQVSGVYPHLTLFNDGTSTMCGTRAGGRYGDGAETGIGAVTPWAGKLWMVTYSPHCPNGSSDKLYSVDRDYSSPA